MWIFAGGVTSMDDFLVKFFPVVYNKEHASTFHEGHYCKYDNQGLQAFTSSLYLAALVASFVASVTTRVLGRKITMLIGGLSFLLGASLNAAAQDLAMLIVGRLFLGFGVGFANQVCHISRTNSFTQCSRLLWLTKCGLCICGWALGVPEWGGWLQVGSPQCPFPIVQRE